MFNRVRGVAGWGALLPRDAPDSDLRCVLTNRNEVGVHDWGGVFLGAVAVAAER